MTNHMWIREDDQNEPSLQNEERMSKTDATAKQWLHMKHKSYSSLISLGKIDSKWIVRWIIKGKGDVALYQSDANKNFRFQLNA